MQTWGKHAKSTQKCPWSENPSRFTIVTTAPFILKMACKGSINARTATAGTHVGKTCCVHVCRQVSWWLRVLFSQRGWSLPSANRKSAMKWFSERFSVSHDEVTHRVTCAASMTDLVIRILEENTWVRRAQGGKLWVPEHRGVMLLGR